MSLSEQELTDFFAWLDEEPCTSNGVLVKTPTGETRNISRDLPLAEFRTRSRWARFPRRERAKAHLSRLTFLLEMEKNPDER